MRKSLHAIFLKRLGLLAVLIMPFISDGQDVHFSQWYATPLQVNPAMTGVFDGVVRLTNSYRTQWSGIGNGYKTFHLSADAPLGKSNTRNNYFGVGGMIYQDKAGEAGFKSTIMEGSLSYITAVDDAGDHFISLGFQAGLNSQVIDLGSSTWDSQWNGDAFDPALPSHESIQLPQFSYLDFNAGAMYFYVPDGSNSFDVGASLSHIGSPNVSFFTLSEAPLRKKITLHSSAEIALGQAGQTWVLPKLLVMKQGNQKEITLGGYIKNKVQFKSRYTNYQKEAYFYLGGFYRWADAAIVSARFEYNTFGLGISYDFNTSSLSNLAGSSNAFEVTLSYVAYVKKGARARNYYKMPRFL
jgi:type IX secretion system PorP/SprF family membrane protein